METNHQKLEAGDRVAVFTGRDYTTIADQGIVVRTADEQRSNTLVYLPDLNSYCLADDESLLLVDEAEDKRSSFAEIVINHTGEDSVSGSYNRFNGYDNTFEILKSEEQGFNFNLYAQRELNGSGSSHLNIRVHSDVKLDTHECVQLLRQVLGLDYVKKVESHI